jgi:hypothetical protein
MDRFDYIIDKIESAGFDQYPFRHVYIENLFNDEDFTEIIRSPEVDIGPVAGDEELLSELHRRNFNEIVFPGTTTDIAAYLKWHGNPAESRHDNQETCEGYGVALRLRKTTEGAILAAADAFFRSDRLWRAMASKFDIASDDVRRDVGLHKYLDGYEISPHPDVRLKALTFMININPAPNAEEIDYNTHYMVLKPGRNYVRQFWSANKTAERCWLPWDWCESRKIQTKNNSMVMFSPDDDTIHSIKASYNHLTTQRTQFYGNLWYNRSTTTSFPSFHELDKMKLS